jgi:hypothetical protein
MAPNTNGWDAPPLSTPSLEAVIHYREGIAALVSGRANADRLLDAAIMLDQRFLLARVGRAVGGVTAGGPYVAPTVPDDGVGRGERQHAEVVATMLGGECGHAFDLRREHLLEFPGDVLIVWLPLLVPQGRR